MKPPIFQGTEYEDFFEFIVACYERLHKMNIMQKYGFEFVSFLLKRDAKKWQRAYVEYWSPSLPSLTQEQLDDLFLKKYVPRALCDHKKDEVLELEQGDMLVVAYEAKYHVLYRYATQLLATKEERI